MNKKNIWGTILTLLGASGLIYAAVWFVNTSAETNNTKALVVLGTLSLVLFMVGINLVNTAKDSA